MKCKINIYALHINNGYSQIGHTIKIFEIVQIETFDSRMQVTYSKKKKKIKFNKVATFGTK